MRLTLLFAVLTAVMAGFACPAGAAENPVQWEWETHWLGRKEMEKLARLLQIPEPKKVFGVSYEKRGEGNKKRGVTFLDKEIGGVLKEALLVHEECHQEQIRNGLFSGRGVPSSSAEQECLTAEWGHLSARKPAVALTKSPKELLLILGVDVTETHLRYVMALPHFFSRSPLARR